MNPSAAKTTRVLIRSLSSERNTGKEFSYCLLIDI